MDKRKLHHLKVKLRPIRSLYLLIFAVIFLVVGLYSARQNNLTALRLRDQVISADKEDGDVETALKNLREYVYSHMNTDLASGPSAIRPPIQLKYRYERLVEAEKQRVTSANAGIYTQAQIECEKRFPKGLSGSGRIPCIQEYVATKGVKEQAIPDSLYKFDFASPAWSPDVAGISFVLSALFMVAFAARLSLDVWLNKQLKDHL